LSIKAATGGAENYFIDGRRITVDDDTFAIFNTDRVYASSIEALQPVHSFSVFFDRGLISQAWHSLVQSASDLDEVSYFEVNPPEFEERLYEHEDLVSPMLRHIRAAVDAGIGEDAWLEEQLLFLLRRMLHLQRRGLRLEAAMPSRKPATRRELMRRINLGLDFMQSRYRDAVLLKDIAAAAHLSPFHFLRVFKSVYRISPAEYVSGKRSAAAMRLLQNSDWTMDEIAEHVGFGSRTSMYRHLRARFGVEPRKLRSSN
jgi:AraC family transcriptional regulator